MPSPSQLAANRENARHSTGPVTPEGKARVAQNALKHGLTAKHLVIREDEREEFDDLHSSLQAELQPSGVLETVAFREILHAAWTLHRLRRLEAEVSLGTIDDFTDPKTSAILDRLTRYQSRAQRAWSRAMQEFRRLQTDRALFLVARPGKTLIPVLVDVAKVEKMAKMAKQSQSAGRAAADREFEDWMQQEEATAARLMAEVRRNRMEGKSTEPRP
jgi:hypothetical protein